MWDVYAERARPSAGAFDCWRHGTEDGKGRRQRSEVRGQEVKERENRIENRVKSYGIWSNKAFYG